MREVNEASVKHLISHMSQSWHVYTHVCAAWYFAVHFNSFITFSWIDLLLKDLSGYLQPPMYFSYLTQDTYTYVWLQDSCRACVGNGVHRTRAFK